MANKNDNLIPGGHKLTLEEQSNGGKRSGEVRREKATMKKALEALLDSKYKNTGKTYRELSVEGLIANSVDKNKGGNPQAHRVIAELLGESMLAKTETRTVERTVVDTSDRNKVLWEDDE